MMPDKLIELNRRRTLVAVLIIGLAVAGTGAGTIAYFSDTESSTNNNITAGTLTLSGANNAQFGLTDTVPDTWHNGTVTATYEGSVDAEVDVNISLAEPSEPDETNASVNNDTTAAQFARQIKVETADLTVGTTTTSLSIGDANNNGYSDLEDLQTAAPFDNATGTTAADQDTVELKLELYFVSDAGNEYQADGVNVTVDLIAEQTNAD